MTALASGSLSDERAVDDDGGWSVVGSRKVDASGDATVAARTAAKDVRVADNASNEWAAHCHEPMRTTSSVSPAAAATSCSPFATPPRSESYIAISGVV